jgi:nicotinamide riboside transporter PnuC
VAIEHINIGWLTANIWHNAQYVLFVWLYNTNRFKTPTPETQGVWMAWLSQRNWKRILAYFGFCIGVTTAFYGALTYGFKAVAPNKEVMLMLYVLSFQTLNFHHYVVDSLIWKARNKKNRTILNVSGA